MTAIICHNPLWVSSLYKDHTIPIDYKQLSASCMPTLHDIKTIKKKKLCYWIHQNYLTVSSSPVFFYLVHIKREQEYEIILFPSGNGKRNGITKQQFHPNQLCFFSFSITSEITNYILMK